MELKGITDLYKTKMTEEGPVEVLLKKNACFRIYCEPFHLGAHAEVLNLRTGQVFKDRCQVHIQDMGVVVVKIAANKLYELKKQHSQNKTVGFHANKGN
jgi:hypothetical protein